MGSKVDVFAFTFIIVGISWLAHRRKFSYAEKIDSPLLWLHLMFLMALCLMPFAGGAPSENGSRLAFVLYVLPYTLSAGMSAYGLRQPELADHPADRDLLWVPIADQIRPACRCRRRSAGDVAAHDAPPAPRPQTKPLRKQSERRVTTGPLRATHLSSCGNTATSGPLCHSEDPMSIDTAAEASTVLPWTPTGRSDSKPANNPAEKPAAKVAPPEPQQNLPPAVPAQIKVDPAPEPTASPAARREAPIAFPVSLPESLDFHAVQPYELDSLTHLARPVSLAVASLATGCALGMLPLVHGALDAVGDVSKVANGVMLWYLIYAMIFALSSGISIIALINALRGRSDARRLLREIRQRPNIPLSQIVRQ